MSKPSDGTLEMKVAPPPASELPDDLNQLALELFKVLLDSDASLAPEWKKAMSEAMSAGLPGDFTALEALAFGGRAQ